MFLEKPRNTSVLITEFLQRQSLKDGVISDNLLYTCLVVLKDIGKETDLPTMQKKIDLVRQTLHLVCSSQQRQNNITRNAAVAAKHALREHVLSGFTVPHPAVRPLLGSSFKSPQLFGTFPEHVTNAASTANASAYRCTPKSRGSSYRSFSPVKYTRPYSANAYVPPAKRARPYAPTSRSRPFRPSSAPRTRQPRPVFPRREGGSKSNNG